MKQHGLWMVVTLVLSSGWLTVGWAQERVAMPPVQPSARGVTATNDCELRLAKMNSGSCPQACMERRPRAGISLTTSDVCTLAEAANWECRWPLVQTPQNGLTCPTGWNGTYDVQIMNESRNCGALLVEVGRTVVRNGCTQQRQVTREQACPAGWPNGKIVQRGTAQFQLNDDLTTSRQMSSPTWLPLANSDVTCSREVVIEDVCPQWEWRSQGWGGTLGASNGYFEACWPQPQTACMGSNQFSSRGGATVDGRSFSSGSSLPVQRGKYGIMTCRTAPECGASSNGMSSNGKSTGNGFTTLDNGSNSRFGQTTTQPERRFKVTLTERLLADLVSVEQTGNAPAWRGVPSDLMQAIDANCPKPPKPLPCNESHPMARCADMQYSTHGGGQWCRQWVCDGSAGGVENDSPGGRRFDSNEDPQKGQSDTRSPGSQGGGGNLF